MRKLEDFKKEKNQEEKSRNLNWGYKNSDTANEHKTPRSQHSYYNERDKSKGNDEGTDYTGPRLKGDPK